MLASEPHSAKRTFKHLETPNKENHCQNRAQDTKQGAIPSPPPRPHTLPQFEFVNFLLQLPYPIRMLFVLSLVLHRQRARLLRLLLRLHMPRPTPREISK